MSCAIQSSGLKSADVALVTGNARLHGLTLIGDGTNAATVTVYDNTSAAGTVIAKLSIAASGALQVDAGGLPHEGVICNNGIYLDVGTNTNVIAYYSVG